MGKPYREKWSSVWYHCLMRSGGKAWIGLAAYVAAWDLIAIKTGRETLSSSFASAVKHPIRRWPVILTWAYITAHLHTICPPRLDVLSRVTYALTPQAKRLGQNLNELL